MYFPVFSESQLQFFFDKLIYLLSESKYSQTNQLPNFQLIIFGTQLCLKLNFLFKGPTSST